MAASRTDRARPGRRAWGPRGLELGQTARPRLAGAARWLERKGQAEHGDGAGRFRRAAGDARPQRAAADQERQTLELAGAQVLDDHEPGGVELPRRGRSAPAGDPVGLFDECDADSFGPGSLARRREIGRLDPAARTMPEDQSGSRFGDGMQVRTCGAVRGLDLEDRHSTDSAIAMPALVRRP